MSRSLFRQVLIGRFPPTLVCLRGGRSWGNGEPHTARGGWGRPLVGRILRRRLPEPPAAPSHGYGTNAGQMALSGSFAPAGGWSGVIYGNEGKQLWGGTEFSRHGESYKELPFGLKVRIPLSVNGPSRRHPRPNGGLSEFVRPAMKSSFFRMFRGACFRKRPGGSKGMRRRAL